MLYIYIYSIIHVGLNSYQLSESQNDIKKQNARSTKAQLEELTASALSDLPKIAFDSSAIPRTYWI